MNKPIRREFLRKLVKAKSIETKKYIWRAYKYIYDNGWDIDRYNKKTKYWECLGKWEWK